MALTSQKYAPLGTDGKVPSAALPANAGGIADPVSKSTRDVIIYVPGGGGWIASRVAYSELTSVPSTFTPTAHTHAESEVTGLVADLAAKEATTNKAAPSGYASLDAATRLPVAQLPQLVADLRVSTADFSMPTNTSAVVALDYELGSGFTTEIGSNAVLEVA